MVEISGGHLVAKYIKDVEGVNIVFGLVGGHIGGILDGFLDYGIKLVDVRNEQAAVMMAHAWTIFRSEPGVCLVTAGPGFTNTLTGIANAYFDNAPVVLLSGTAPVRDCDKGAFQDVNQLDMIKSAVKWSGICYDAKRIPEYLSLAFRHAVSGRPGPVFLALPPDVLNIKVNEKETPLPKRGNRVYKSAPDPADIEMAASIINSSEKPVLIGGSGVGFSDCDRELLDFVNKTGMPFMLINHGRGSIADSHPLSLWQGGQTAMMTAFMQTDLIIALGIRFHSALMFGKVFPQAKVIKVDIDPTEIDRNRDSDIGLVGDIGLALRELNKMVAHRDLSIWAKTLRDIYLPLVAEEVAQREKSMEPIHPARLVEQVRKATNDDAIYIVDGGDTAYFGYVGLRAKEKSSVIGAGGTLFGCIGAGIPFGIGAKLARPEKQIIVISGDGSFGFNIMEYATAVRHGIPFVCVICNDQAWGLIKHSQEVSYGADRLVGSELGLVHYEEVVEALGGYGEIVRKDEEVVPAINRAIDSGKPACINVLTDPTVTSLVTLLLIESLKME
jgi:acetolactate synthase-1/2/3 large subunit